MTSEFCVLSYINELGVVVGSIAVGWLENPCLEELKLTLPGTWDTKLVFMISFMYVAGFRCTFRS